VTDTPQTCKPEVIKEYITAMKSSPRIGPQITHHEVLNADRPRYGEIATPWPSPIRNAMAAINISRLYHHQAQAIDRIRQGENVIVATPTASGKSLIYNLPVFERLLQQPDARALYLFPLKALAQDQLRGIEHLNSCLPEDSRVSAALYDGDTAAYRRRKLRQQTPQILITNPDMLHLSLLGYHDQWAGFLAGLSHVIIDEVHTYRGVFGSHMAWVIRRLTRLCSHYGSRPRFILSSATIGNPAEMSRLLLGSAASVVGESTAPQPKKHFIFINPFDSAAFMATQLLEAACKRQLRTIVYTQSRKMTELIYVWTKNRLGNLAKRLSPYRAGYRPEERRIIEKQLHDGNLLGVVATSALELGIDIGALDLCLLLGYPGTIMTTWQRSGRVGRSLHESLTILIAQQDALDQYFMRYPADFFNRQVEDAVLNPGNRSIMKHHLVCAAAELPLGHKKEPLVNESRIQGIVTELETEGRLLLSADGSRWFSNRKYPHRYTELRGSGLSYTIRSADDQSILGEIDGYRCMKECYPGAIYLHRGQTWLIKKLNTVGREVVAQRRRVNYFTRALGEKNTRILEVHQGRRHGAFTISTGRLRVTDIVTGFQRRMVNSQKLLSTESLEMEPCILETEGLWIEIPAAVQHEIEQRQLHFMGGIHALEHGLIGIFPLLVLCDRNDVGGIAFPFHEQLPGAGIFIYDGYQEGVGLSCKAFEKIEELFSLAHRVITDCTCEIGCPSCIHSPKCGSGNRPMDKTAAVLILKHFLNRTQPAGRRSMTGVRMKATPPAVSVAGKNKRTGDLQQVSSLHYGVFDVETKRSASEVGGWHHAERMGISVAVLYDAQLDAFCTYRENQIPALIDHLKKLDLVVGFNIKRFDNRVLSAYTAFDLSSLPTLDILEEITTRLGYRISLEKLALHTLGEKKRGDGLQALQWYKEGRIDEIIDYCRFDVEITRNLYLYGLANNYLLFANKAGNVVRLPVIFDKTFINDQEKEGYRTSSP
jgi:DEAD/DEAH box helicase domain-containing protein